MNRHAVVARVVRVRSFKDGLFGLVLDHGLVSATLCYWTVHIARDLLLDISG
jgi:hypothetical protein